MKFSIIIPVYNKAAYIGATLASVAGQTYRDFEVIVVDDGSTDGSGDIVERSGDPRVRLVRKANAGVSAARNIGIAQARGEWIAFLDADDLWSPDYLQTQVETMASNPSADMVGTGYERFEDHKAWTAQPVAQPGERRVELITDLPRRWMKSICFFTSSLAVRASRLRAEKIWFPEGETIGEDLDLWFRLAESSAIAYVPHALVGYRVATQGSLTNGRVIDQLPPFLLRLQARGNSGTLTPMQRHSVRAFIGEEQVSYARAAIQQHRRFMTVRWLMRATPYGFSSRRWWMTVLMFFVPTTAVNNWQSWRMRLAVAKQ